MPPPRRDRKIRNSVGNFRPRASSRRSSSSSLAGSVNMCCCRPFATTATTSSIVTGDLLEPVEEEEERRALLEGVTGFGGIEESGVRMRSQGDDPVLAEPEQTRVELVPVDPAAQGATEVRDPSGAGTQAASRQGGGRFTQCPLKVRE